MLFLPMFYCLCILGITKSKRSLQHANLMFYVKNFSGQVQLQVFRSIGLFDEQVINICQQLSMQLSNMNLNLANYKEDRIIVGQLLADVASSVMVANNWNVAANNWNVLVCDANTCDWNFASCNELYLIIVYQGYFVEIFQCQKFFNQNLL